MLDRLRQAIHQVASMHSWETRPLTYLGVVYMGCVVSAKPEKRSHLAMEIEIGNSKSSSHLYLSVCYGDTTLIMKHANPVR